MKVNKILFVLLFVNVLISCNQNKIVKKFYEDGSLKEVHIYKNGIKTDSSIYYFPSEDKVRQIRYWLRDKNYTVNYSNKGIKVSEGTSDNENLKLRLGNWKFTDFRKEIDSIVEYMEIENSSYVNQIWLVNNQTSDTLGGGSNFFEIYAKDTIKLGELFRIRFYLVEPYYSYNSDIEVILPSNDEDLKEDYSNLFSIERDTFRSLKNDGIPHPEIPKDVPINHYVEFGIQFQKAGKKCLKGALIEYLNKDIINSKGKKINRIFRALYFDKRVYVVSNDSD